ncbi:MAG: hypothetical protein Q4E43_06595 [Akkermansia sp.]|nr:hypothetical protein [Akkermansia sp.]
MKIYKLSSVRSVVKRGGKRATIKVYRHVNQNERVVLSLRKNYLCLTHGEDNQTYSCLVENIRRMRIL